MSRSISKNINNSDKQQREPGGNWGVRSEVDEEEEEEEEWKRGSPPPSRGRETEIRTRRANEHRDRERQGAWSVKECEDLVNRTTIGENAIRNLTSLSRQTPIHSRPCESPLPPPPSPLSNPINCTLPRHSFASRRWISSLLPITFSRNYFTTFRHDVQTERTER